MYLSIDPIVYRTIPALPRQHGEPQPPLEKGFLDGRAAICPACLLSHYHPFDPSTKWLSNGAPNLWIIFHCMWRPGNAGAWQHQGWRVIVTATRILCAVNARAEIV
jgi:hypothetical protein